MNIDHLKEIEYSWTIGISYNSINLGNVERRRNNHIQTEQARLCLMD